MPQMRPWLMPLVPLYRLGLFAREAALRTGLEPVRRLGWPVVSIGNLSIGGAGKTPLTIALAQALRRRGVHVDVLSRGYGRRSAAAVRVDPEGTAEEFGDEPILIARATGAPVYVASQRYQAGLLAERDMFESSGVHLLDDGFQHRQLQRDVNILLLHPSDLDEKLLPAGNLREPLAAMRRADVLAIPRQHALTIEPALRTQGQWQGPLWHFERTMNAPQIDGPVVGFCAIARPEQFFEGLRGAGLRLAGCMSFPDHHRYTQDDLHSLRTAARAARAVAFATTEKDQVRLGTLGAQLAEMCPVHPAQLEITIEENDAATDWLMSRLTARLPAAQ